MVTAHLPTLTRSPDALAADYKRLLAGFRGWREMKGAMKLRSVFHHRRTASAPTSSRAGWHCFCCALVENTTGDT